MRILRLVLAIAILVQGIIIKDVVSIILGLIVGGMAITNTGCCENNGCEVKSTGTNKTNRVHYEELDRKK